MSETKGTQPRPRQQKAVSRDARITSRVSPPRPTLAPRSRVRPLPGVHLLVPSVPARFLPRASATTATGPDAPGEELPRQRRLPADRKGGSRWGRI
jgi:hypothetical protein